MASLTVPRNSTRIDRTFGPAAALFLVGWAGAVLIELPRRASLALGLSGFTVLTTLWLSAVARRGFVERRRTSVEALLGLGGLLVTVGAAAIAVVASGYAPEWGPFSRATWGVGVLLALLALAVDGLSRYVEHLDTGSPTGRVVVGSFLAGYLSLAVGAYATFAVPFGFPSPLAGAAAVSHLLTGAVTVLVFAGLAALAPRGYGRALPRPLVVVGLPSAVVGPPLVAAGLPAGTLLRVGGALELVAFVTFALALAVTLVRGTQRPAGSGGLLAGFAFGVAGVALGGAFAQFAAVAELVVVHARLTLLGFLGLTLLGATRYSLRHTGLPLGLALTAALSVGLLLEVAAGRLGIPLSVGRGVVVLATVVYAVDVGRALFAPATKD